METTAHKANATAAGLEWADVMTAYREARALDVADVERRTAVRRAAFKALSGVEHGGRVKLARREGWTTGDATSIPGLDVVAADMGMAADALYHELQQPAPEPRDADTVMAETIERLAALVPTAAGEVGMMPLVQAAAMADVTEQWLRQLVKAGRVRGRKAGRNWVVRWADVAAFRRHPTAGRPRFRHAQESAPF